MLTQSIPAYMFCKFSYILRTQTIRSAHKGSKPGKMSTLESIAEPIETKLAILFPVTENTAWEIAFWWATIILSVPAAVLALDMFDARKPTPLFP